MKPLGRVEAPFTEVTAVIFLLFKGGVVWFGTREILNDKSTF